MNKRVRGIISLSILILLIFFAYRYVSQNIDDFDSITIKNPFFIFILFILSFISYYLNGVSTKILLAPLNVKLNNNEAFGTSVLTGFYNMITPFRGGIAARAVYLKKKHGFSYTNFLASLAALVVISFIVISIMGLVSVWFIWARFKIFSLILFLLFCITLLAMLTLIIISPYVKETKYKWMNFFLKIATGWKLLKNDKKIIINLILLNVISQIIGALTLLFQYKVIGIEITIMQAIFISSIAAFSLWIGLTPASLGIQEALTVFSAVAIGLSASETLFAAIIGRLVSSVFLFILGPIYSYYMLKKKDN